MIVTVLGSAATAAPPQIDPLQVEQPDCLLDTLPADQCLWWALGDAPASTGDGFSMILGCLEAADTESSSEPPGASEDDDDGGDDEEEASDDDGHGGGTPPPDSDGSGEGDAIGTPGRVVVLASWPLPPGNSCPDPVVVSFEAGTLTCWDTNAGQLCGRAFTVTAWQDQLPAEGVLSEPICVPLDGPADREQAEAELMQEFLNADD